MSLSVIERLLAEQRDLSIRLTNLQAFRASDPFQALPFDQATLLTAQGAIMEAYLAVLSARLRLMGLAP